MTRLDKLTPRQLECVRLAAEGYSYKQAAYEMGCARQTVRIHMASARQRLGAITTAQAVMFAIGQGLISPQELAR